jgi:ubiquinone biosynthesis protein
LAREGVFADVDPSNLPPATSLPLRAARLLERRNSSKTSNRLAKAVAKLGPSYIKLGQFLATRPDLVGAKAALELEELQDRLAPFSKALAIESIESALGRSIGEIFEEFGDPVAAASIAQVHKAKINGKDVVLKIKRPGISEKFSKDLGIIEGFVNLVDKSLMDSVFTDFKESFKKEIDFQTEIQNMKMFNTMYIDSTIVKIPKVFPELSTNDIIVMENVPSSDILRSLNTDTASQVMNMFLQQILFEGEVHGDLHAGNLGLSRGKIVLYDFGNVISIPESYQNGMRELFGAIQSRDEDKILQNMKDMGMKINDEAETRVFIRGYLNYLETVDVNAFSAANFTSKIPVQFDKVTFQIIRTTGLVEGTCKKIDPNFSYQRAILLCIELMALGY